MKPHTRAKVVTFGLTEANDVRASHIVLDWPNGTHFNLHAYGETRHVTIRSLVVPWSIPSLPLLQPALLKDVLLTKSFPPSRNSLPLQEGLSQFDFQMVRIFCAMILNHP